MIARVARPEICAKIAMMKQEEPGARGEADGGRHRAPHLERAVGLLVLDRVAHLVGGDRDRGDRAAGVDLLREVDGAVPRVVVIRERPTGRRVHRNAREAVVLEDHQRDLLAAHPVRNGDLHLLADGLLQPVLDHEPDDQRRNQEDEVEAEACN